MPEICIRALFYDQTYTVYSFQEHMHQGWRAESAGSKFPGESKGRLSTY